MDGYIICKPYEYIFWGTVQLFHALGVVHHSIFIIRGRGVHDIWILQTLKNVYPKNMSRKMRTAPLIMYIWDWYSYRLKLEAQNFCIFKPKYIFFENRQPLHIFRNPLSDKYWTALTTWSQKGMFQWNDYSTISASTHWIVVPVVLGTYVQNHRY